MDFLIDRKTYILKNAQSITSGCFYGGFGGGGCCSYGNGGGGGYTGGNGSYNCTYSGGGGGSFNIDPNGTKTLGWFEDGKCEITFIESKLDCVL